MRVARYLGLFVFGVVLAFPCAAFAKTETITASSRYVLGDNDAKSDAKKAAFLEVKRLLIEKVGTYLQSQTKVVNGRLTKDEIESYSAALMSVEVVDESWSMKGASMVLDLTVKSDVDREKMLNEMTKLLADSSAKNQVNLQQKQIQALEKKLADLQRQVVGADDEKAIVLRKERRAVFEQIDEVSAKKIKIMDRINAYNKSVPELIEIGMTRTDVRSLCGKPSLEGNPYWYQYGTVRVVFDDGMVGCVVRSPCGSYNHNYCFEYQVDCRIK